MASRSNRYQSDEGKEVWKELEKVSRFGYGYSEIFTDWIDLALNSLLSLTANIGKPDLLERMRENRLDDEYNARYLEITKRYRENESRPRGERPADYFATAWGLLVKETQEKREDILGQIFTERVTFGEHGQYFTPTCLTGLMTKLTGSENKDGETVCDPCCGSGRFLISMAKENPNLLFYGQDVDLRCAKMTALNLWMFDLNGTVRCGDSLGNRWSVGYEIRKGGYIWEIHPPAKIETPEAEPENPEPPATETHVKRETDDELAKKIETQMMLQL